jgi:hypothetical protein
MLKIDYPFPVEFSISGVMDTINLKQNAWLKELTIPIKNSFQQD